MLGELPFYVVRRGQITKQTVAGSVGSGRFDTDTNDEDMFSQVCSGGDDASGFNASLAAATEHITVARAVSDKEERGEQ